MVKPLSQLPYVREQVLDLISFHFGTKELPRDLGTIYAATTGNGFICMGTFTIEPDDLPGSGLPGPWLAGLVVAERYRGKGLGRHLIHKAVRVNGDKPLYAWCRTPVYWNMFFREGFEFVKPVEIKGGPTKAALFRHNGYGTSVAAYSGGRNRVGPPSLLRPRRSRTPGKERMRDTSSEP